MDDARQTSTTGSDQTPPAAESTPVEYDYHGRPKLPIHRRLYRSLLTPGSAVQIILAAAFAIAIGMIVVTQVPRSRIPVAVSPLVGIPGTLWLRALRATVLPLIVTAMILAVVRLREMTGGGAKLARTTIGWYVITTCLAIIHSVIMVDLVWRKLMTEVGAESLAVKEKDAKTIEERKKTAIHEVVVQMFESLVPNNIVNALATDSLLAVLVSSVIIGYLINPRGSLMRGVEEVEKVVTKIITFLVMIAPIGVFFLILPNLFRLDLAEMGRNMGVLVGAAIAHMFFHLFVLIPALVFLVIRKNPYPIWYLSSPCWLTAWGSASSAATLPVTIREMLARGIPNTVAKFSGPLGCLINMDGTAIYFPICVVFLAQTQGIVLNAAQYVIIVLLATLASIGTTPIPSSSLVLTVMIAQSVDVPITGMYAVIVAIDWFVDRFRTATNVSCDLYAAAVVTKICKIKDDDDTNSDMDAAQAALDRQYAPQTADNTHRV